MKTTFMLLGLLLGGWLGCLVAAPAEIDDTTARLEMARVLRDSGQHPAAIAAYQELLQKHPHHRSAACELAEVFIWSKQPEQAAQLLADIPEEEWTPSGWAAAAALDTERGQLAQAEKRWRRLLELQPSDTVRVNLALVLSWQKKYEEALPLLAELVEKNPRDVQLRRNYAQILGWAGKPEAASEQWRLSLEETP